MSLTDQTLLSRLSLGRQSPKQHASLALLVSGLVVGDVDVVTHSARELDGSNGSCDLNRCGRRRRRC